MLVISYTEARKNFSALLDKVEIDGAAIVKRSDGSMFRITAEPTESHTPFDGIKSFADLSRKEIVDIVHEGRSRK